MHEEMVARGLFFALFSLFVMGGWIVATVIFLVAVWRTMKAHESIAGSVKEAVEVLRSKAGH
jgi:hypothetical protein